MAEAFRLEGSSMLPVFKPGQLVLVQPSGGGSGPGPAAGPGLKSGDCAVYSYKGSVLLHRVVRTAPEGAWLADDAGRLEPHLVPWADIRGKALSRNPLSSGFCGFVYSSLRRRVSKLCMNV